MRIKHAHAIVIFTALVLIPSCGPSRGTVSGVVTYNEKPLTHGSVIFIGADGIPVTVPIFDNGKYTAKGVLYGDCFVAVRQTAKGAKSPAEIRKEYQDKGEEPSREELMAGTISTIPTAYADVATSELKLTVSEPKTTFDIPLVDKDEQTP